MVTVLSSKERESDFFNFLDNSPPKVLESVIQNGIIPLMRIRRRKIEEMPTFEVLYHLHRPKTLHKMGEEDELDIELSTKGIQGINPPVAGELADHAYYRLQPNITQGEHLARWYQRTRIASLGIPFKSILTFGIIKYTNRIDHGSSPYYKRIEHMALARYLGLHPELTNLWITNRGSSRHQSRILDTWSDVIFDQP